MTKPNTAQNKNFTLHPQLAADTLLVCKLTLCQVRLMNDSQFPWLILIPERDDCRELYELSDADQALFHAESLLVSKAIMQHFKGDKLNVAALGNMVPQLHIHHIVRFESDVAWPAPVWGKQAPVAYEDDELKKIIEIIRDIIAAN